MEREPVRVLLRRLRESLKISQKKLGVKLGHNQNWVTGRELGKVDTTADEALAMIDAMGLAAEIVVLPAEQRELLAGLAVAKPDDLALALRLARVLPGLDKNTREVLEALISTYERQAREATAG